MQLLTAYDWPGNVRELENAVEASTIIAKDTIKPNHLPSSITNAFGKTLPEKLKTLPKTMNLDNRIQELEKGMIIDALTNTMGIQKKAASLLNIKERSLWHRIKKFNIDATSFKQQ